MTTPRALPTTVVTMPTPVIVAGKPTMPALRGAPVSHSIIRKITYGGPPKQPAAQVAAAVWYHPAARWTVESLPDPGGYPNGWYWLGEPSPYDGTIGIQHAAQFWPPTDASRIQHYWHSVFPFKPSVASRDDYLQGGGVVHHPRGVNFNSFYVEHMWLDLGRNYPQPFTWVIACMVANWPYPVQHLLDAGKPPPRRYTVEELAWTHTLASENLGYRTMLELRQHRVDMATRASPAGILRLNHPVPTSPRMYVGVYNTNNSYLGVFGPEGKRLLRGKVLPGGAHRYMILGRQQGFIARNRSSHLLIFEMRYWTGALAPDVLDDLYRDISGRWQFGRYARGG